MTTARRAARRLVHTSAYTVAALALLAGDAGARDVHSFKGGPAGPAATEAAASFERALSAAAAPSAMDRIESQQVAPFLTSSGDRLLVYSALGSPSIAKDPALGFTLDIAGEPLRIAPAWVAGHAAAPGTIDRNAAVFPAVATSTDAIVRPTAAGVATYLQIGDRLAGDSYEWTVALRAGERLCELDDGSVAVVAGDCGRNGGGAERRAGIAAGPRSDSRAQYDRAKSRHAAAASQVPGRVVAVFQPPEAADASGSPVATRLDAEGAVVSLTVRHNHGLTSYPAVAALEVSYADAWQRGWTHVEGIGPAQRTGGLVRALMPSGKTFVTHGPDEADTDALESDPTQEFDESGQRSESGGTPFDPGSDEEIDPFADDPEDANGNKPIGGSGPPFVCGDEDLQRLTLVYAGPTTEPSEATVARIRKVLTQMNDKLYGESIASGTRSNPARFRVTCSEKGVAMVRTVQSTSDDVVEVLQDAIAQGVNDPDSKYLIFSETERNGECGIGDIKEDDSNAITNLSNENSVLNPSDTVEGGWAVLWGRRCWTSDVGMHENAHTMGAVQESAPNANGTDEDGEPLLHCSDGYDVLCYQEYFGEGGEFEAPYSTDECNLGNRGFRFDCHYDDYFDTAPENGEYLSEHWNLGAKINLFLHFGKPRPFHEPYVFNASNGTDVSGVHRSADGDNAKPEVLYNVTGDAPAGNGVLHPALAPDGKRIAFAADGTSSQCTDIYTMNLEGGPRQLVFDCSAHGFVSATNPEFMSDGRIAFDHLGEIWWVKTDGSDAHPEIGWGNGQSQPTYSGSGKLMAFTSVLDEDGSPFGFDPLHGTRSAIFIATRHGNAKVQFTPMSRFVRAESPKFSHDGAWISFSGVEEGETEGHVYIARIDGSGLQRISDSPGGYGADWTPTGRIVYSQVLDPSNTAVAALVKEDPGDGSIAVLQEGFASVGEVAFRQASYPVPATNDPSEYELPEYGPIP
jgi:Tol biopolymer transport system component